MKTSQKTTIAKTFNMRAYRAVKAIEAANVVYREPAVGNGYKLTEKRRANEIARVVGERVMVIRREIGFTQVELCEIAGIPNSNLSRLENGKGLNFCSLVQIADTLGVPLAILLEGTTKNGEPFFLTP